MIRFPDDTKISGSVIKHEGGGVGGASGGRREAVVGRGDDRGRTGDGQ